MLVLSATLKCRHGKVQDHKKKGVPKKRYQFRSLSCLIETLQMYTHSQQGLSTASILPTRLNFPCAWSKTLQVSPADDGAGGIELQPAPGEPAAGQPGLSGGGGARGRAAMQTDEGDSDGRGFASDTDGDEGEATPTHHEVSDGGASGAQVINKIDCFR
jgi:hypothetical protein